VFGGSGTTLIACEKLNRYAFLMELDPRYVDVIIQRWQDYSGKEAVRQSDGFTLEAARQQKTSPDQTSPAVSSTMLQ